MGTDQVKLDLDGATAVLSFKKDTLRRLTVTAGEGGITGQHLRAIPIGGIAARRRSPEPVLLALTRQPGVRQPDSFYRAAWLAYQHLRGSGMGAAEMASANGVSVTTVHRWIKEARRRGLTGGV